jgi:hypothetical protein
MNLIFLSVHECDIYFRRKSNILVIHHQIVEQQYIYEEKKYGKRSIYEIEIIGLSKKYGSIYIYIYILMGFWQVYQNY